MTEPAVAASPFPDFDPMAMVDPGLDITRRIVADEIDAARRAIYVPSSVAAAGPGSGVCDLLDAFAGSTTSPVDMIDRLTDAIAASRTGREAVLSLIENARSAAEDSARRWREGCARPLEGIPFGVKDIIDVAGAPVTSGSLLTGDRLASADAAVVAQMKAAGAIPFAMTATTEFAAGSPFNPRYGAVTNPWDAGRWTGGSSTGSGAALAARLMPLALGTDTGGSIRVPSSWCGTTGLKPTRDLVSRVGVSPLSWTLDHVGPMARSARDIAATLPFMIARHDPALSADMEGLLNAADPGDLTGMVLGVAGGWFTDHVDSAVLVRFRAALLMLERAGARLVDLPELPIADFHAAGWVILTSELATLQRPQMDRAELFDAGLLARIRMGLAHSAADYGQALQMRIVAQRAFLAAMEGMDAIITPGLGGEAGSLATLTVDVDGAAHAFQDIISRNTMIFDLLGFPALMMPAGAGATGLPTGIQIAARPYGEAACLTVAMAFQHQTDHHRQAPPS